MKNKKDHVALIHFKSWVTDYNRSVYILEVNKQPSKYSATKYCKIKYKHNDMLSKRLFVVLGKFSIMKRNISRRKKWVFGLK